MRNLTIFESLNSEKIVEKGCRLSRLLLWVREEKVQTEIEKEWNKQDKNVQIFSFSFYRPPPLHFIWQESIWDDQIRHHQQTSLCSFVYSFLYRVVGACRVHHRPFSSSSSWSSSFLIWLSLFTLLTKHVDNSFLPWVCATTIYHDTHTQRQRKRSCFFSLRFQRVFIYTNFPCRTTTPNRYDVFS